MKCMSLFVQRVLNANTKLKWFIKLKKSWLGFIISIFSSNNKFEVKGVCCIWLSGVLSAISKSGVNF